uniref:Cyclin C-terminal domain-containing protein n=1 Tax=Aegilops tauschii subsp. strangulata TaxID=200361 RepID=A0A453SUE1_AEGTS
SVIRYALNQRPYATHCRGTNGQDLIRELIREHHFLFRGAGAAAVRFGAVQALQVAAAAVYAAKLTLKKTPLWTDTLKHHTGFTEAQLMDAAKILV